MMLWELLDLTAEAKPFGAPEFVGLELGEEFKIISDQKAPVHRVKTLDLALSVLESELRANDQADVRLVYRGGGLHVAMFNELGRPWGRNIPKLIEELRMAVSHFSMGEGWPPIIYGQQVSVSRVARQYVEKGKSQWT